MYFISLSVTLFIIIAAVHLLAKVKNENLGLLSKLIAYVVLLTAALMLACQVYRGVGKMGGKHGKECRKEMRMGEDGEHMKIKKKFRHGKEGKCEMNMSGDNCCKMGGMEDGCCAGEGMKCEMECCKDSAAASHCKGMEKEVEEIIETEEKK